MTLESAALAKKYWQDYFKDLNPDDYQDEQLKRQVKNLRILGNAALNEEKLTKVSVFFERLDLQEYVSAN